MIEKQILKQKLQEGKSKRQIAKELFSSEPTIRKYIKKLFCSSFCYSTRTKL